MTKGEKSELVFKRVYYMGVFLLSYNSRSSETFIGSSCNLKSDGALILLDGAWCSDFDALCSDTFDVLFCMLIPR